MKIRNKQTGEIREISEKELEQYGLGGKLNKLGVKNSLWNNIRANKGSGKKPTKAMLEQERKIRAAEKAYGGYMQMGGGLTDPFMGYGGMYAMGGYLPMAEEGVQQGVPYRQPLMMAPQVNNVEETSPFSTIQRALPQGVDYSKQIPFKLGVAPEDRPYNPLLDNGQIVQTPDDLLYPGNASTNNQPINTTAPYAAKKAIPSLGAKGAKGLGANPLNKEDDKYWSPEVDKGYKSGSSTEERFKSRFAKDRTGKPSFNFSLPNFMNSLGYLSGNILSLLGSGATMQTMYPSSLSYGYSPYGNMGFGFGMNPYMYGQQYENRAYGGGIDNPGFRALPDYVQEKIKANMATGGCMECGGRMAEGGKLPKEILRARLESHMSPNEAQDYIDSYGMGGYLDEAGEGKWIQKATASIKRRGTEGVCTGSKFGSSSCPPGSKRYNLAKTFRKLSKSKKKELGGYVEEGVYDMTQEEFDRLQKAGFTLQKV